MNSEEIRPLNLKELLDGKDCYSIPIYQRNYAWGKGEINLLIQDVLDYIDKAQDYYIGTLVVSERGTSTYDVIDGQQRLTTLTLLVMYLRENYPNSLFWYQKPNISFECRTSSSTTLQALFEKITEKTSINNDDEASLNTALLSGYKIITEDFSNLLKEKDVSEERFLNYLLNKVKIFRVRLPDKTDLNHYFEVVNNRGEQLEKHEVLKALLLEVLNQSEGSEKYRHQATLNAIWEACSDMDRYVQAGFVPALREKLFGYTWDDLKVTDFDALGTILGDVTDDEPTNEDRKVDENDDCFLSNIISLPYSENAVSNGKQENNSTDDGDKDVRFHSVLNFQNFLLQVLSIQEGGDVSLDDKALLTTFDSAIFELETSKAIEKVKIFVSNLLKLRYLFDRYVIKREYLSGSDKWSLKYYTRSNDSRNSSYYKSSFDANSGWLSLNRQILMLLSAFHVSVPSQPYKYWLIAALQYLSDDKKNVPTESGINGCDYLRHMEDVARSFVFDRYVSNDAERMSYQKMIYENEGVCQAAKCDGVKADDISPKLQYKSIENNLLFNYLDYLLWLDNRRSNDRILKFEFSFRSSVEHYYPQNPRDAEPMNDDELHSFGNLCLISHSKNSRLSDLIPSAKKGHYLKSLDSVKQFLMMEMTTDVTPWNERSVTDHGGEMIKRLIESLPVQSVQI